MLTRLKSLLRALERKDSRVARLTAIENGVRALDAARRAAGEGGVSQTCCFDSNKR